VSPLEGAHTLLWWTQLNDLCASFVGDGYTSNHDMVTRLLEPIVYFSSLGDDAASSIISWFENLVVEVPNIAVPPQQGADTITP
jgi:hypothetical protein